MNKKDTLTVCEQHLFSPAEQMAHLAPQYRERILRIRSAYTLWLDNPTKKEKDIVNHLLNFGVEKSQAYEDVRIIKILLGNINKASKDWHRFKFNAMIDLAYQRAKTKDNEKEMINASKVYAQFNQLDKEEQREYDWAQIKPQNIEITSDPTILGIKAIPNIQDRIEALKKKYSADIEDVVYEEIDIEAVEDYARY